MHAGLVIWIPWDPTFNIYKSYVQSQGCHSEFGSNKVRKMVRQGKEKRLLARIFKILGKARKRLSRQNSTRKVRKCEEKWPEFHKKHINFRIMCSNRIDTREGSEWGTVYWDQIGTNRIQIQIKRWNHWRTPGWSEHTAQLVFTQSHKYTVDNVHRENETDQIHPPIPLLDMFLQFTII